MKRTRSIRNNKKNKPNSIDKGNKGNNRNESNDVPRQRIKENQKDDTQRDIGKNDNGKRNDNDGKNKLTGRIMGQRGQILNTSLRYVKKVFLSYVPDTE
jgi:hypothetical protein